MPTGFRCRRSLTAALLLLAAACVDRNPVGPGPAAPAPPPALTRLTCTVDVATARMSCTQQSASAGAAQANIIGGQDVYVKLASSGTAYDNGTQILSSTVTVQNLLQQKMGTPDGVTVAGVQVFFETGPVLTSGTGNVSVANADGTGTFTTGMQPYFQYNQILEPFEISSGKLWQFNVDATVGSFAFTVLVNAPLSTPGSADRGFVWNGDVSADWADPANWDGNAVPDSTGTVAVPVADSVTNMPVLSGNVSVANLRVAQGSTLGLAGFTLQASGNVDAVGAIGGGTVRMTGPGALLRGNVAALVLTGSVSLQGAAKATGAVSVQDGPLTLNGNALSISVP